MRRAKGEPNPKFTAMVNAEIAKHTGKGRYKTGNPKLDDPAYAERMRKAGARVFDQFDRQPGWVKDFDRNS